MSGDGVVVASGARFFDGTRELGWAREVTKRSRMVSTLTTFDVAGAEPELAKVLTFLDRCPLRIQCTDLAGTTYEFSWASGYGNGAVVRIQGVLQPRLRSG
jgi:hypothetical protein